MNEILLWSDVTMKNVVVFGNCQAAVLAKILRRTMPSSYQFKNIYNNERSGSVPPNQLILEVMRKADLIIYQPLRSNHFFSEEFIQNTFNSIDLIRFPYIYNNAYAGLVPKDDAISSFYGEEFIVNSLCEFGYKKTLLRIKNNQLSFEVEDRFKLSLSELSHRENTCEINISNFISEHYRYFPLFDTRNHPTYPVIAELARQIHSLVGVSYKAYVEPLCWGGLPRPFNCVSALDVTALGLLYGYHKNWYDVYASVVSRLHNNTNSLIKPNTIYTKTYYFEKNEKIDHIDLSKQLYCLYEQNFIAHVNYFYGDFFESDSIPKKKENCSENLFANALNFYYKQDFICSLEYLKKAILINENEPVFWFVNLCLNVKINTNYRYNECVKRIIYLTKDVIDIRLESFAIRFLRKADFYHESIAGLLAQLFKNNKLGLVSLSLYYLRFECYDKFFLLFNILLKDSQIRKHELFKVAVKLRNSKKIQEAVDLISCSNFDFSKDFDFTMLIGNLYFELGDYKKAKAQFEYAAVINVVSPNPYIRIAHCFKKMQLHQEAVTSTKIAVKKDHL